MHRTARCGNSNSANTAAPLPPTAHAAEHICIHIRAAVECNGFSPELRAAAAAYLVVQRVIAVDTAAGICSCPLLADPGKTAHFRPAAGFCTCHDRTLHGICCHLLAGLQLPEFQGLQLPARVQLESVSDERSRVRQAFGQPREGELRWWSPCSPITMQPTTNTGARTFQTPNNEPLGDLWQAELQSQLAVVRQTSNDGIRRAQSNADPCVGAFRADLAAAERAMVRLPEGEGREELRRAAADLRSIADRLTEAAQLPVTETRAGKQQRRRNGRPENQHKVTALFPGRRNVRLRAPLVEQAEGQDAQALSDPLPTLAKKGKAVNKVRDPACLPGRSITKEAPSCYHVCPVPSVHVPGCQPACRCAAPPCQATWTAPLCATAPPTSAAASGAAPTRRARRRCDYSGSHPLASHRYQSCSRVLWPTIAQGGQHREHALHLGAAQQNA